ncbi:hypothetical protein ACO0QE_003406 [Hanseniaspora vineae]
MGRVSAKKQRRHDPLMTDLTSHEGHFKEAPRSSKKQNAADDNDNDDENDAPEYIDARQSRKILQLAKEQQQELEENEEEKQEQLSSISKFRVRDEDDEDEEDEDNEVNPALASDEENVEPAENEEYEEEEEEVIEINEDDAAMFDNYFKPSSAFNSANGAYNLADKIMAAIREKEMGLAAASTGTEAPFMAQQEEDRGEGVALPPKLIKAYTTIGTILTTWTHGKLPKLFKIIPTLKNWQDVLYVTDPESWTPHVCYEATKLFVSNLGAREAAKFVNMVLLPRFQYEVEENEKHDVNYHIYRALKKSLYKPSAFFKGFLFPMVEYGCNVREAMIAGSILQKVSVPVLHSSAALAWLVQQKYSPAAVVFIRILLEKKYALPYQTVDECVFYFMRFRNQIDGREVNGVVTVLPVAWHKAFLAFAQRYKNDITEDQKEFLLETVRQRPHPEISKEIRRELLAGKSREFVEPTNGPANDLMLDI